MADWDGTVAKVTKIMGPKTKVPDIPASVTKAKTEFDKTWSEFEKARDAAEEKLLAWVDSTSGFENAADQFSSKVAGSDLGSDKSAADYKKKRAEAQKLFDAFFKELDGISKENMKNAKELNKHMDSLSGYKSPKSPTV